MPDEEKPETKPIRKRDYTAEEWEILEVVARSRSWEFAEKNAYLILDQARAIGELDEEEDEPTIVDNGVTLTKGEL
jgi:hypothetical protein